MAEAVLPALLLTQPGRGVGRQFAGHRHAGQEQGPPALDPAAVGEVEIFGDGIALPAAARLDRSALPDAAGPVEGQRMAGPAARRLLDADPLLSELEVRRAGLAEAFTELTRDSVAEKEAA